LQQY